MAPEPGDFPEPSTHYRKSLAFVRTRDLRWWVLALLDQANLRPSRRRVTRCGHGGIAQHIPRRTRIVVHVELIVFVRRVPPIILL